jgi:hypothetical protein
MEEKDRVQWQVLVNLQVLLKVGEFLNQLRDYQLFKTTSWR